MSTISGIPRPKPDAETITPALEFANSLLEMHNVSVQGLAQRLIDNESGGEPVPGAIATWADLQSQYLRPSQNHLEMGIVEARHHGNSPMFQNVAEDLKAHVDTFMPANLFDEFNPLRSVDLSNDRLKRGDDFDQVLAEETVACVELVAILAMHEVVAYEDPTALKYAMEAIMKLRENLGTTQALSGHVFLNIMQFLKRATIVAAVERIHGIEPKDAGHTKDLHDEYTEVFMIYARAAGARATEL